MARKHQLDEVLRRLSKKKDLRIDRIGVISILSDNIWDDKLGTIPNPSKVNDLGNGSWGMIDYLTKVHNYTVLTVAKFR